MDQFMANIDLMLFGGNKVETVCSTESEPVYGQH